MRLKIEIEIDFESESLLKIWHYLDINIIKTIDSFRQDIIKTIKRIKNTNDIIFVKLSVDEYDLPLFETTRLFRDCDIVKASIITNRFVKSKNSKRKSSFELLERSEKKANLDLEEEEDWDLEIPLNNNSKITTVDYEACLIGSSMIKSIDPKQIFPDKRCHFKSISGGKIKDVHNYLKNNANLLKNSQYFIVTCGSNDCDSLNNINDVLNDYLELAEYLKNTFNTSSCFIFNKLIPRTKCRYVSLLEFEKRRTCFNNFLEVYVPLTVSCIIVDHLAFEIKTDLNDLLLDGVHISPFKGLPIYVEQIKSKLK